jgi:hypothetical protein
MNTQQNNPNKVTFIALAIIIVVSLGIYFYYQGEPVDGTGSLDTALVGGSAESADARVVSDRIVTLLNQVNDIKIKTDLFQSAVYSSLVDYTITVPEENVGRSNPFAPVGGYVLPPASVRVIR